MSDGAQFTDTCLGGATGPNRSPLAVPLFGGVWKRALRLTVKLASHMFVALNKSVGRSRLPHLVALFNPSVSCFHRVVLRVNQRRGAFGRSRQERPTAVVQDQSALTPSTGAEPAIRWSDEPDDSLAESGVKSSRSSVKGAEPDLTFQPLPRLRDLTSA